MRGLLALLAKALLACALALATLPWDYRTGERQLYGDWDPALSNWQEREVAGWPAPFMRDREGITEVHEVGIEDEFLPAPFLASASFWLLVVLALGALLRRFSGRNVQQAESRQD